MISGTLNHGLLAKSKLKEYVRQPDVVKLMQNYLTGRY